MGYVVDAKSTVVFFSQATFDCCRHAPACVSDSGRRKWRASTTVISSAVSSAHVSVAIQRSEEKGSKSCQMLGSLATLSVTTDISAVYIDPVVTWSIARADMNVIRLPWVKNATSR